MMISRCLLIKKALVSLAHISQKLKFRCNFPNHVTEVALLLQLFSFLVIGCYCIINTNYFKGSELSSAIIPRNLHTYIYFIDTTRSYLFSPFHHILIMHQLYLYCFWWFVMYHNITFLQMTSWFIFIILIRERFLGWFLKK